MASYIHGANRIGVLVGLSADAPEAGKDIAMQIAALNPVAIDEASVLLKLLSAKETLQPNKLSKTLRWPASLPK